MPVTTFTAVEDSQVNYGNPIDNYGSSTNAGLFAWSDDEGLPPRVLVKFDLSAIPLNATINSAYLTFVARTSDVGPLGVSRVTSAWSEMSVTWLNRPGEQGVYSLFTAPCTAGARYSPGFDVKSAMVDNLAQAKSYGFAVYPTGGNQGRSVYLREQGAAYAPQLTVDYTIPNTAPNAPVLGFSDGQVLNTRTPTITWTFSDPDGNSQGAYYIEVINGSYAAPLWNSGWITDANARSYTLPAGAIPSDGQCYIRMKVTDSHGAVNQANGNGPDSNFGNRRLIIDTVAPTIASVSAQQFNRNANTPTRIWAYGLSDTTSGVSYVTVFLVRPDGSYYQTNNAINAGNGNWYMDVTWNNDVQGNWGVDFRGVDAAGNTGNMARANVYVDSTPPTIASVQGYSYTNQSTGTRRVWAYGVTDSGSGINQVLCNYTVPGKSTVSSVNCTASGSDYFVDIPLSVQGEYRVDFYCVDKAGNWMSNPSSKTAYFFVDSQRPNDPDPNVTYGTTTALFSWKAFADPSPSSGYDKTYMYLGEWNGSGWVGTPLYNGTNIGNVLTLSVNGLKQGARYRYTVTQYDKTGNESSYTYKEFVTKRKIGEYRIQKSGQLLSLPVYDPNSGINGPKAIRTAVTAGIGCLELVPINDVNASPIRLVTSQGVKAISK